MNNISLVMPVDDATIYASLFNEVTPHGAYTIFYLQNMFVMDLSLIIGITIMFMGLFSIFLIPKATYILLSMSAFVLSVALGLIFISKMPSLLLMLFSIYGVYLHVKEELVREEKERLGVVSV
jgi:hypothetical protein